MTDTVTVVEFVVDERPLPEPDRTSVTIPVAGLWSFWRGVWRLEQRD